MTENVSAPQSKEQDNQQTYRQYDFKFALILLLLLAYILKLTLSFPMSGSYGGVENQWYVSPALFPLILLSALFLCCVSLLISSVKQQGNQIKTTCIIEFNEALINSRYYPALKDFYAQRIKKESEKIVLVKI